MEALSLFGAARSSDPETSKAAARSIDPSSQEAACLRWLLVRGELTRDLLAGITKIDPYEVSSRLGTLQRRGYVEKTDRTLVGESGRAQILYRLTDEGSYFTKWRLR
jgi:predicted ArsR family transcriptional regulator